MSNSNLTIYAKGKYGKFFKFATERREVLLDIFPTYDITNATEFSSDYLSDEDALLYVDLSNKQAIIKKYVDLLANTSATNEIDKNEYGNIKLIFVGEKTANNNTNIRFQRLFPRYCFHKPIFTFDDVCSLKTNEKIIILNNLTDAYYDGDTKRLYFTSFKNASAILKLDEFYRTATDEDIQKFKQLSILQVKSDIAIRNKNILRKVAQIVDEGTTLTTTQLTDYAAKYHQTLSTTSDGKIKIDDQEEINLLFDLLKERLFTSEINNTQYRTNSIQRI